MTATTQQRRRGGMDPRTVRLDPDGGRFRVAASFGGGTAREVARFNATVANTVVGPAWSGEGQRSDEAIAARVARRTERDLVLTAQQTRLACLRCAVREDAHDEFGCRRWMAA